MPDLILASRSPQRRAILEQLGIDFEQRTPAVEELTAGPPRQVALTNARRKAEAVAEARLPVLGVDTVVCIGARMFDKPRDHEEARATLEALRGRVHEVISGICLIDGGAVRTAAATTAVQFRELDDAVVDWYVAGGEWLDRAGGYAIQGRGAALVKRIDGDYLNVVGLPLGTLLDLAPWLLPALCS